MDIVGSINCLFIIFILISEFCKYKSIKLDIPLAKASIVKGIPAKIQYAVYILPLITISKLRMAKIKNKFGINKLSSLIISFFNSK